MFSLCKHTELWILRIRTLFCAYAVLRLKEKDYVLRGRAVTHQGLLPTHKLRSGKREKSDQTNRPISHFRQIQRWSQREVLSDLPQSLPSSPLKTTWTGSSGDALNKPRACKGGVWSNARGHTQGLEQLEGLSHDGPLREGWEVSLRMVSGFPTSDSVQGGGGGSAGVSWNSRF